MGRRRKEKRRNKEYSEVQRGEKEGAAGRRNLSPQQYCPSVFCRSTNRIMDIINQLKLKRKTQRERERDE